MNGHDSPSSPCPEKDSSTEGADSLWLDDQRFAEYAAQLERQDWEDEVRRAAHTLYQLVEARRDTIEKLLLGADYLDSVWLRCRVSKTVGTSTSIIGGGLTIAGGIMTLATAGAGAPILIAGIATSSVGAASNIGTSLIEKVVNSRQVKELNAAFGRDRELVEKLAGQVGSLEKFGESGRTVELLDMAARLLGEHHLLLHILKGAVAGEPTFLHEETSPVSNSSTTTTAATASPSHQEVGSDSPRSSRGGEDQEKPYMSLVESRPSSTKTLLTQTSSDTVAYSPLDSGVIVESGKVIGQNSFKAAGQVVLGLSAAFMVWDAIDLGCNITDLVRREGSQAARLLRGRAALLESALQDTLGRFSVKLPS